MLPYNTILLNYLMIIMIVLSVINIIYNTFTTRLKVVYVTSLTVLANSAVLLYFNHNQNNFELAFIPFGAGFGPLFYAHTAIFDKSRKLKFVSIHCLLPLCFIFSYIIIVSSVPDIKERIAQLYLLQFLEGISIFFYGLFIILIKHLNISVKLRNLIVLNAFLMTIMALSIIVETLKTIQIGATIDRHSYQQLTFCLLAGGFGWTYFISCFWVMSSHRSLIDKHVSLYESNERESFEVAIDYKATVESKRYAKSKLSDEQLSAYQTILELKVNETMLFADHDLTLEKLAKLLRIPASHLTQVLNVRMGTNFYAYINGLRITYAISIIRNGNHSLNDVYIRSGFNNRVSFNRYFKKHTDVTPSEYVKALENSAE